MPKGIISEDAGSNDRLRKDILAWIRLNKFSERYDKDAGSKDIIVATPYTKFVEKMPVIYVQSKRQYINLEDALKSALNPAYATNRQELPPLANAEKLIIVTENPEKYALKGIRIERISTNGQAVSQPIELDPNLKEYIYSFFSQLSLISPTLLTRVDNPKALLDHIMKKVQDTELVRIGEKMHEAMENIAKGKMPSEGIDDYELIKPLVENAKGELEKLKEEGYSIKCAEKEVSTKFNNVIHGFDWNIDVAGQIDAILEHKDGSVLLLDYKTGETKAYAKEYTEQLELYRRIYAAEYKIPTEKVKIAILYVGLRGTFDKLENAKAELYVPNNEEIADAGERIEEKAKKLFAYYKDPGLFIKVLSKNNKGN